MQRCRIKFLLPGRVEFSVQAGEEETAEELVQQLTKGRAPTWLEALVLESVDIEDIEVEDVEILGREPALDEELVFD